MTVFKVSDSFKLQGWWYVLLGPWTFKVVVVTLLVGVDSRTAIGQSCGSEYLNTVTPLDQIKSRTSWEGTFSAQDPISSFEFEIRFFSGI